MALNRVPELIALICWWAEERETKLTTVQLVKYLYLADLFYARRNAGQTLTGWPWAFVFFGPYCTESMAAIDRAVDRGFVERAQYDSKHADKHFYLHRPLVRNEPTLSNDLPSYVISGLKWAIKKWADDTAGLLNYVYFHTEPMRGIEPHDQLDFRRARPPEVSKPMESGKWSEKKRRKALELIAALRRRTLEAKQETPCDTGPHDELYHEAVAHDDMDALEEGFSTVAILGDLRQPEGDE